MTRAIALALAAAALCCGGRPEVPSREVRQGREHTKADEERVAGSRPSWCGSALAEIAASQRVLPPRDTAPDEVRALEELARRMDAEAEALSALAPLSPLQGAAGAANEVSAATWAVLSRTHVDLGDRASARRALAITLRKRERAGFVLRGHCGENPPEGDPTDGWKSRAFAVLASLGPAVRACAELPVAGRPQRLHFLARLDATGRVTLAVPVDVSFELGVWGPTDVAYCIVRLLEATRFPEPNGNVTLLVPLEGGVRPEPP